MMDNNQQLRQRVDAAIKNLRNEMIAAGIDDNILPVDEISVEITNDGVVVKFFKVETKKVKKATDDV